MKNVYFAVSYDQRKEFKNIYEKLKIHLMFRRHLHLVALVYDVEKSKTPKMMMDKAKSSIEKSEFLIAEGTYKQIGVGIEAGYAHGLNKPIIYIRKTSRPVSSTLVGIADFEIEYNQAEDLITKLRKPITKLMGEEHSDNLHQAKKLIISHQSSNLKAES